MLRHPCYTAPSLRLFVPNSLTVPHRPFLPRAELATSLSCGSAPSAAIILHTTTSAPSLEQLVPSGWLISFQSVRFISIIQSLQIYYFTRHKQPVFFSITLSLSHTTVGDVNHGVAGASTFPAPLTPNPLVRASSFLEVAHSSTISGFWIPSPEVLGASTMHGSSLSAVRWTSLVLATRATIRKPSCRILVTSSRCYVAAAVFYLSSLFVRCLVAAVLGLCPLSLRCIRGLSNV
jgi:hypothetical protein